MAKNKTVRRRLALELIALGLLIVLCVQQWPTLSAALHTIGSSNLYYVAGAMAIVWILLLPLTALNYQLLVEKSLSLWQMALAQLAGNGPGRIVPGGFGPISVSVLYLKKSGIPTQQAVMVGAVNNLIGMLVNTVLLATLFILRDDIKLLATTHVHSSTLVIVGLSSFVVIVGGWYLLTRYKKHFHGLRAWHREARQLYLHPGHTALVFVNSLLILFGNVAILLFVSRALHTPIGYTDALVAMSVGVLIGTVFPTPGGLGGVEAGIASTLIFLQVEPVAATGIALLYRLATYWQPIVPGTLAYLYLRERKKL